MDDRQELVACLCVVGGLRGSQGQENHRAASPLGGRETIGAFPWEAEEINQLTAGLPAEPSRRRRCEAAPGSA